MKMNGKEQFLNADESLEKFLATTEKYISSEGIVDKKVNPEVELVLSLKADQISNLTAEQCAEVAYLLYAYCSHIQKVYNKNLAKLEWCNNALWRILAKEIDQYGTKYTKYEQKYQQAIAGNDFARKVNEIKLHVEARVLWLTDKTRDIRKMADSLMELSKRKTYS